MSMRFFFRSSINFKSEFRGKNVFTSAKSKSAMRVGQIPQISKFQNGSKWCLSTFSTNGIDSWKKMFISRAHLVSCTEVFKRVGSFGVEPLHSWKDALLQKWVFSASVEIIVTTSTVALVDNGLGWDFFFLRPQPLESAECLDLTPDLV